MSAPARRRRTDRTLLALLAVTVLALLARVAFLGDRIAHWDEGRVGYDVLRYSATGAWEYRPIVHGPFLPHVNKVVFELLGPTDFSSRLVVAVIGALLPLSAWLYRAHLRDVEVVALGVFLAFDPVLLYYSRFMRNDVLLATFAFAAVGFYVRALDTGRRRHLFFGTALAALAFTTKENAIVYVLAVTGAALLLFDHRLFLARGGDPPWTDVARRRLRRTARGLWAWRLPLVVALLEFLVIVVFFYAPREAADGGVGLWAAFAQPAMVPAVLEEATVGSARKLGALWIDGPHQDHAYLPYFREYVWVLGSASGAMALLAVIGFGHDRYARDRPRDLVALASYWGFVSVLGYPIAMDIQAAWMVAHAIVPLAIPAAVGVGLVVDWTRDAYDADDRLGVGLAAIILVLVVGQMAGTAVSTSYLNPQGDDNVLVQFAQPAGDLREPLVLTGTAVRDNDGLDVLWYGEYFLVEDESAAHRLPIGDGEWYNRLPLPWYHEVDGATVDSTASPPDLADRIAEERPPVVVTRASEADAIAGELSGYREFRGDGRQLVGGESELVFVIYIDEPYAEGRGAVPESIRE